MVGGYFASKYNWTIDEKGGGGRQEEYIQSISDGSHLEVKGLLERSGVNMYSASI